MKFPNLNQNKSFIIILALMIMTICLAIALGLNAISVSRIRMYSEIEDSLKAFYAADTGIEKTMTINTDELEKKYTGSINGSAYAYEVNIVCATGFSDCPFPPPDNTCEASHLCYRSTGSYGDVKRKIEIER